MVQPQSFPNRGLGARFSEAFPHGAKWVFVCWELSRYWFYSYGGGGAEAIFTV